MPRIILLFASLYINFYTLDNVFSLKTIHIANDISRQIYLSANLQEAKYERANFASNAEVLCYVYDIGHESENQMLLVSYIQHPFDNSKVRCSSAEVMYGNNAEYNTSIAEKGFWYNYSVTYSSAANELIIQKSIGSNLIILIVITLLFIARVLYDKLHRKEKI